MLFGKKKPSAPKSFSRVIPSRWLVEYSGILPHCSRQNVPICHYLLCSSVDPQRKPMLLAAGVEVSEAEQSTHVLWCFCILTKDHGEIRLLFRRYLDISAAKDPGYQDWIAFKMAQHLHVRLISLADFHYLIPCASKREYPWCAQKGSFGIYWETEINVKLQGLMKSAG